MVSSWWCKRSLSKLKTSNYSSIFGFCFIIIHVSSVLKLSKIYSLFSYGCNHVSLKVLYYLASVNFRISICMFSWTIMSERKCSWQVSNYNNYFIIMVPKFNKVNSLIFDSIDFDTHSNCLRLSRSPHIFISIFKYFIDCLIFDFVAHEVR